MHVTATVRHVYISSVSIISCDTNLTIISLRAIITFLASALVGIVPSSHKTCNTALYRAGTRRQQLRSHSTAISSLPGSSSSRHIWMAEHYCSLSCYFCFHLDPDIDLVLLILPLHRGHYTFCIHTCILQRNQCSQYRFMRANLLVNTANKYCCG